MRQRSLKSFIFVILVAIFFLYKQLTVVSIQIHDTELGDAVRTMKEPFVFLIKNETRDKETLLLAGFRYCSHLDGSLFDRSIHIKSKTLIRIALLNSIPFKTVSEYVPASALSLELLVTLIDSIAEIYAEEIQGIIRWRRERVVERDTKRLGCLMAADGNTLWGRYVQGTSKFLLFINKNGYFDQLRFYDRRMEWNMQSVGQELDEMRMGSLMRSEYPLKLNYDGPRATKLAIFIMAHRSMKRLQSIIELLADDNVFILIHVDARKEQFKMDLMQWIQARQFPQVRVMDTSIAVYWGDSTMVKVTLAGYFELIDWSLDWEYVINISGDDLPLKSPKEIMDILATYPRATNFIASAEKTEADMQNIEDRLNGFMHVRVPDQDAYHPFAEPLRPLKFRRVASGSEEKLAVVQTLQSEYFGKFKFPYQDWRLRKHHQWMNLHRSFILYIRQSPLAAQLLAYCEYLNIPDEHYFMLLAQNSRLFSSTIQEFSMRHIVIDGWHPTVWTSAKRPHRRMVMRAREDPKYFFTRKVELENEWHENGLIRIVFPEKWEQLHDQYEPQNLKK
jgi:hypothetical protein